MRKDISIFRILGVSLLFSFSMLISIGNSWSDDKVSLTMPDQRIVHDNLILSLQSKDDYTRIVSAYVLGGVKNPKVIKPLIKALKDSHPEVRKAALMSLKRKNDPEARKAVLEHSSNAGK